MKILQSKPILGVSCFIVGVAAVLISQRLLGRQTQPESMAKKMNPIFDQFYDDDFFNSSHDPFEQMRKMRARMLREFNESDDGFGGFDSWYRGRFGGGNAGEIKKREDDQYAYYDIAIQGLDEKSLNIKVSQGQIRISGEVEKKSEENGGSSYARSNFFRSFPVPPGVDSDQVKIEKSGEKVTLKFPKQAS